MEPDRDHVRDVLEHFWLRRDEVAESHTSQGTQGVAATVSGLHMTAIQNYVRSLFVDAGLPPESVLPNSPSVPGYFRRSKSWDIVATYKGTLVGAIELKSQVGSVGNNANNRIEEAIGNAVDLSTAHKMNQSFGALPPWTAFVMILEETTTTEREIRPVSGPQPFPFDVEFSKATYSKQYQIAISRFMSEKLYDAGWFVTTQRDSSTGLITYNEPLATATARSLASAISGRVAYVKSVLDE